MSMVLPAASTASTGARSSSRSMPGQGRERVAEQIRHPLKPVEIARAAVDCGPGEHLVEHRLGARAFDGFALGGRQFPHGDGS